MNLWAADGTPGVNGRAVLVSRGTDPPPGYVKRSR